MATSAVGSRPGAATYDARVTGLPPASPARERIASLDIVRGVVMILMAIDHVRVYSGLPAGGPTPGIFFTRWITHFVAPAFVFLAGTAAYLHGGKPGGRGALSRFLVTRGLWLVFLELTVLRVAWTFNLDFAHYLLAGVIWMLGICMIIMAALVRLPVAANAAVGVSIIALHNLTSLAPASMERLGEGSAGWLWTILYLGGPVQIGGHATPLIVLFVIVPWIGVMMTGYAFGAVMRMPAERRRAIALRIGIAAVAAFIALRALDVYGDPRPWHGSRLPAALAFLGTSKYPASLLFLLMTLGPMFIGVAIAERAQGGVARVLATYGRVPLFYYMLHIPLIHAAACVVSWIREGRVNPWLFTNHPMAPGPVPPGYTWSLPLLYLVFALCVAALYVPCRWFAHVRATRRSAWLSYL
jgi:uncharacterized membrane protein